MSAYREPGEVPEYPDEYWIPRFDSGWCLWEHHVVYRRVHETAYALALSHARWNGKARVPARVTQVDVR